MNPTTFAWAYLLLLVVAAAAGLFLLRIEAGLVLIVGILGALPVIPIVNHLRQRHH